MNARTLLLSAAAVTALDRNADAKPAVVDGHASQLEITRTDRSPDELIFRIVPRPGWHTYWLNPGDAGAPPDLRWDRSPAHEPLRMDAPQKIVDEGVTTFGFRRAAKVVTATPAYNANAGAFSWVMCNGSSCIPERATFSLSSVPRESEPTPPVIRHVGAERWTVTGQFAILTLSISDRRRIRSAYFFPFEQGKIAPSAPQNPSRLPSGDWRLMLRMRHTRPHPIRVAARVRQVQGEGHARAGWAQSGDWRGDHDRGVQEGGVHPREGAQGSALSQSGGYEATHRAPYRSPERGACSCVLGSRVGVTPICRLARSIEPIGREAGVPRGDPRLFQSSSVALGGISAEVTRDPRTARSSKR